MSDIYLAESLFLAQPAEPIWETTVGAKLREIAATLPDAPALVEITDEGGTAREWTYGQLLADSERLARALSTRFQPGDRVVVWAPNIPEWVLMEYACALAGLVLVTANPSFQPKELKYVIEQSDAVALFLVDEFRGNPMADIAEAAIAGNPALREVTRLDDWAAMTGHGTRPAVLPDVAPSAAAQIQYTSGTTGFPKGAVLSHRGLLNNARYYCGRAGINQGSVWANFMPLFHTAGCATGVLGSLQAGCKMLLIKRFDAAVLARLTEEQGVTAYFAVPTMLVALLETLAAVPRDMSSTDTILSGGAPVPPELVRQVQEKIGCHFQTAFGQTEASPMISLNPQTASLEDICETAGPPLPETAVSIRSTETNAVMPIGEVGEICVQSYGVMIGYHANPEATAAAIDTQGWLHTGDLGTMDARGVIRVTGRVKDMIIRGGENHFPAEIEAVLIEHPDIAEVAVVGLPDPKWGEIIAAFYRTETGADLAEQELRAHCRTHLSPQKTPAVWQRVTEFPLTGSGKIQKFALRDHYLSSLEPMRAKAG